MSKKWFLVRAVVTLVVIGLLAVGGFAAYRTGLSQGYAAGQLGAESEEGTTMPWGFGYHGRPFGFAPRPFGAGLLVTIVLALLFFAVIGKLLRFVIWGPAWRFGMAGPWPGHWRRFRHHWPHGPMSHGPVPPWHWGWEKPSEEETGEAGPDAETGAAEAEG